MSQSDGAQSGSDAFLRKLHEQPHQPISEWLRVPAHVQYEAFRMSDPPADRPASRAEFQSLLERFDVPEDRIELRDNFGYGVKEAENGDRLILIWQAHTEYYNYQFWHVPSSMTSMLTFGPLTFPAAPVSLTPLGSVVCRLDIILKMGALPSRDEVRG